jgi:glycine/D-amino acid oxidase-like deaminating enzyme
MLVPQTRFHPGQATRVKHTTAMPPSLWASVTKPSGDYPPLIGAKSVDAVVVGAGFTGLSAALHLRRAGVSTIVVEAAEPGWGASGRNNGQVIPTLSRVDPDEIIARHRLAGERFVSLIRDSAQQLFDTIREEAIVTEAEQTGWVQPVHSPGRMAMAEQRVAQWSRAGAKVALLSRDEVTKKLGTAAWHGGWWAPSGGHINPLSLARGLARAVVDRGGIIHASSPALSFGRAGTRWVVTTPQGRVDARALVLATNATTNSFSQRLAPALDREMVPIKSWQMATIPIPDAIRREVLPERSAMSDTRAELRFARYDARHRLVTGGALMTSVGTGVSLMPMIARRLVEMFPALADVPGGIQFDYVWNGPIGMTMDFLPRVHSLGPDGFAWVGCNGRGVALAMAIGREFARGVIGIPRIELALPFTEPEPVRFHGVVKRFAPFALLAARRRDAREI